MQVERVDFVSFFTQDIARARRFYADVLGFGIESEGDGDLELTCGLLMLHRRFAPFPDGRMP